MSEICYFLSMKFDLISVERDSHKSLYDVSSHRHNHYEIVYYISGNGEIIIDDKKYSFVANTFSITKPNYSHREYSKDNVDLIYVGFTVPEGCNFNAKNGLYKCPTVVKLLSVLKEIKIEHEQKWLYNEDRISCLIESVIVLVRRAIAMNKQNSLEMEEVKRYIYENVEKNLTGILVAQHFNYSYDYFRKIFKEYFRVSISDFIAKTRVDYAFKLLKRTNLSVKQIAKKCGFSTTSHFISLFKKFYKVTPKQFLLNFDKNAEKNTKL